MLSRGHPPITTANRAAVMTILIMTAKLNDVAPLAWLANVLARIADILQGRLADR
jgi:transposase